MENEKVVERLEQLKSRSGFILDRDGLENLMEDLKTGQTGGADL